MLATTSNTCYKRVDITSLPQIARCFRNNSSPISLDTETTGLNPRTCKMVTIQFGTTQNAFILDCRPFYEVGTDQALWRDSIQELLDACPLVIGHNLKFDYKVLYHHFGVKLDRVADTMLQELVLYGVGMGGAENMGIQVNMFDTAKRYGFTVSKEERSWFIDLDTRDEWTQPLPETQLLYCVQDVVIPHHIYIRQALALTDKELTDIANLENACVPAIARMELDGCYVDREKWTHIIAAKKVQREALERELQAVLTPYIHKQRQATYTQGKQALDQWETLKQQIEISLREKHASGGTGMTWGTFKLAGMKAFKEEYPRPKTPKLDESPINLGSHVQLKQALFCLGVEVESTDREHLAPYARTYPIVKQLLKWKELDKFINAFGDSLLAKIEDDNRIHPTYNQIGAATGRMSCSQPNWQQIPAHEPEETSVRRCVIGETGNMLLTADFSNIELRILAEISQDENMLGLFASGADLHSRTAHIMFGLPDDIDPKHAELKPGLTYRSVAKTINFGLVYGMSPIKLAKTLGVAKEVAEELFQKYFEAYPGVAAWLEQTAKQALQQGYSLTLAGRKRFYPLTPEPQYWEESMLWSQYLEMRSQWHIARGSYERQAKNAPIQGSNADITKYALVLLYKHIPPYVKLVACVHDEIVLECPEEKVQAVSKLLAMAMYKACKKYLHTVFIPPVEVEIERYWKKG